MFIRRAVPVIAKIPNECREIRRRSLVVMNRSFYVLFSGGSEFDVFDVFVPRNEKRVVMVLVSLISGKSPLIVYRE